MHRASRGLTILLVVGTTGMPAAAQENSAWPERVTIAFDVPFQVLTNRFSEALTFPDTIRTSQTAQFGADYALTRGALFDLGGAVRVARHIGAGVAVSVLRRTSDAAFTLAVPSLIAGNPALPLCGSVPELEHRDVGVHLQALYAFGLGHAARLTVSGGPSIFNTSQEMVRSIEFDILPGLTTVKFDQAFVTSAAKTVVGFNVGADVTWNVAAHVGVGTIARYSRATVTFDPRSASGVNRGVTLHSGGLHVGVALRVRL
jgi:hypothetical protein